MAALPAVALWRWRGSTTLAARTSSPAPAERRTSSTAATGASPAMASAAVVAAVPSLPRTLMDGLSTPARFAASGTAESALALLDGILLAIGEEAADATAGGEDHVAAVLMCMAADVMDAIDALGE
jgi:hypothetical protein